MAATLWHLLEGAPSLLNWSQSPKKFKDITLKKTLGGSNIPIHCFHVIECIMKFISIGCSIFQCCRHCIQSLYVHIFLWKNRVKGFRETVSQRKLMHELIKNPLTGSISEFWYSWDLSNFICESFNSSDRFFLHLCYTFHPLIWSIFRRVTWWCTHKKATAFDYDTKKNNTSNWWKCYDTRYCLSRFWVRLGPDLQRPNRTNSTNVKTCLSEIYCTSSEFFY